MTTLVPVAVEQLRDGRLAATCLRCRVHVQSLAGTSPQLALAAFEAAHPADGAAEHALRPPPGWRAPLSFPGALSQ